MKTTFNPGEKRILEEVRDKLSKVMGVTMVDGHITVRYGHNGLKSVTMQIVSIDVDNDMEECFGCGEEYRTDELHETEVSITLCGGTKYTDTEKMCYDCYCPK